MYFVVDSAVCICNRLGKIAEELENPVFALTFYLCLLDEAVKIRVCQKTGSADSVLALVVEELD